MSGAHEPTILIVEDQEGLAEAYTAVLARDYEVRTAHGGEDALEIVDDDVDVALLDRRMPGMSGDEVLKELIGRDLDAQIAMLTAVEPDTDIFDMPFDDYVTKPIDNDDLLSLVETLLELDNYDEDQQERFRLTRKKKALEATGKQGSEEYQEISDRLDALAKDADESIEALLETSRFQNLDPLK